MGYAQVTGTGISDFDHFATRVANTQKRITWDREARQNNVIIFNMDEKDNESKIDLDKKFEELCKEIDPKAKYNVTLERIGKNREKSIKKSQQNPAEKNTTDKNINEQNTTEQNTTEQNTTEKDTT